MNNATCTCNWTNMHPVLLLSVARGLTQSDLLETPPQTQLRTRTQTCQLFLISCPHYVVNFFKRACPTPPLHILLFKEFLPKDVETCVHMHTSLEHPNTSGMACMQSTLRWYSGWGWMQSTVKCKSVGLNAKHLLRYHVNLLLFIINGTTLFWLLERCRVSIIQGHHFCYAAHRPPLGSALKLSVLYTKPI